MSILEQQVLDFLLSLTPNSVWIVKKRLATARKPQEQQAGSGVSQVFEDGPAGPNEDKKAY